MEVARIDHRSIAILGLVTICSYGCWYYAFGVLLDPIRTDTGWSESSLAASFSVGTALIGLFSLGGGRLLDRVGHRRVLSIAGAVGGAGLLLASFATHVTIFFAGAAVGLGTFGSLGFYHVTMTTAVRLNPDEPKRAIAVLTMWGAFASAIFLPLTAWLVDSTDWRTTVRVLAAIATFVLLLAAVALPAVVSEPDRPERPPLIHVIRATLSRRETCWFTVAIACGGVAMSTLLVYQVPIMTTAGLSAGTAATMAGLRGFAQIGGRVPLTPIVGRLGSNRSLMLAFSAIAVGGAIVTVAGTIGVAVLFAVVAGFGIGAFSPLQGMKAEELFDRSALGATMGLYSSVLLLAGSIGPVAAGVIAERSGERRWVSLIVVGAATLAATATWRMDYGREDE